MKKLNNKGFTLIEIVIVIVIIAILAAMLVPSLTAWIDNANKKTFLEAANTIKTSTLAQLTENYAVGKKGIDWNAVGETANCEIGADKDYQVTLDPAVSDTAVYGNTLSTFTVENAKYTVTFDNAEGTWGEVTAK